MNWRYISPEHNPKNATFKDFWDHESEAFLESGKYPDVEFFDGLWGDFSFFSNCGRHIRKLDIMNDDKKMAGVKSLRQLDHLIVRFKNKDMFDYSSLPNLRHLELIWGAKSGLSSLNHSKLKKISIDYLPPLKERISNSVLEGMFLVSPKVADFSFLTEFVGLNSLRVQGARKLETLNGLPPNLENLQVDLKTSLNDVSALKQTKVKAFTFRNSAYFDQFPSVFYELEGLEHFSYVCKPVTVQWEKVMELPSLKSLAITVIPSCIPNQEDLAQLATKYGREVEEFEVIGSKKEPTVMFTLTD